ncbi:MAG: hypothetical protein WCO00_14290 [Rhodospirillaceae bacterium]
MAAGSGRIPHAFSGISSDGSQVIFILDGLPLDHIECDNLIRAALYAERAVVFSYGSVFLTYDDKTHTKSEELVISAGNTARFVQGSWPVLRSANGAIALGDPSFLTGNDPDQYPNTWFLCPNGQRQSIAKSIDVWNHVRSNAHYKKINFSTASSSSESQLSLRDKIRRDFGIDLLISGGYSKSSDDPIYVEAKDTHGADITEMELIKCIGRGGNLLWRTIGITPLTDSTLQRKIETQSLTENEVTTQTTNWYFLRTSSSARTATMPVVYRDNAAHIDFPYDIGWVHYDSFTDYEAKVPGLGYSLLYKAFGINATIYVYKKNGNTVPLELEKARADIIRARGVHTIKHEWEPHHEYNRSSYFYIPSNDDPSVDGIVVFDAGLNFGKIRITIIDDEVRRGMMNDCIARITAIIMGHQTVQ